jgi:hypothetical protein
MRSVPLAMTWEMLQRGKWHLLGALLFGCVFPASIIHVLQQAGGFNSLEQTGVVLHFCFVQLDMFIFGAAVVYAQGRPSRLYTFPISSQSIAAWHLLLGMVTMFLGSIVMSATLNAIFDVGWPLWGPALFFAVAFVAINAALWFAENSGLLLFILTLFSFVLGIWNKTRYGAAFSQPDHLWLEVTPGEVATMVGFAGFFFVFAMLGVSRNRRGEPLPAIGLVAMLERLGDYWIERERHLKTPDQAQFWYEWRQKGWAMPAIVLFALCANGVGWLIFNRQVSDVYPALIAGGGLLTIAGIIAGLFAGHMGSADTNFSMRTFLATRPMTTTQISRISLKMMMQSIFLAWMIWLVAVIAVRVLFLLTGYTQPADASVHIEWWYYPATFVGPWITAGAVASMGMSGRAAFFLKLFCVLMALWVAAIVVTQFFPLVETIVSLSIGLTMVCGVIFILTTAWVFVAAVRRSLIEPVVVYICAAIWVAGSLIIATNWLPHSVAAISQLIFVIGALALAVAPFASTPLALAWNRHR